MIGHSRRGLFRRLGCLGGGSLGRLGSFWGPPGGLLGPFWGHPGTDWGLLGASWGRLGRDRSSKRGVLIRLPLRRPKWGQHPSKTNDLGFLAEAVWTLRRHAKPLVQVRGEGVGGR
eukprot:7954367-Pyramimonas_sp.AAC.1